MDNKERASVFKEIDCTGENNNFLKNACLDNITDNWNLGAGKTEHIQRPCQVQKVFVANLLRMSRRFQRVL